MEGGTGVLVSIEEVRVSHVTTNRRGEAARGEKSVREVLFNVGLLIIRR